MLILSCLGEHRSLWSHAGLVTVAALCIRDFNTHFRDGFVSLSVDPQSLVFNFSHLM